MMLAATVMVAAAALCVWCAARSRSPLQIVAASVMFMAMLDHGITLLVSPVIWAALLIGGSLLVGASLRPAQVDTGAGAGGPELSSDRAQGVLCAIAYPAMAALMLLRTAPPFTRGAEIAASGVAAMNAGAESGIGEVVHHHGGTPPAGWLVAAVVVLVVALGGVAVAALREGRRVAAVEAGAMSLMLGSMLA
ncbi:hypothetical protein ACI1US_00523 [Leucobacter sp. BZR 635]